MKKFIKVSVLEKLFVMINQNYLNMYHETQENLYKILSIVKRVGYTVALDNSEIELLLNFIVKNQNMMTDSIDIIVYLCQALHRPAKTKIDNNTKQYYFKMLWVNDGKIPAIKALREMIKGIYNSGDINNNPYCAEFGGLRWAKEAVEQDVKFGPVSEDFLNHVTEYHHLMKISKSNSAIGGIDYKNFVEQY